MTMTKPWRPLRSSSDLCSSSLIHGGRPNLGRPERRSGRLDDALLAATLVRFAVLGKGLTSAAEPGSADVTSPCGGSLGGGRDRSSSRGLPPDSRLGKMIVGRFVSPDEVAVMTKSTGFTNVTVFGPQRVRSGIARIISTFTGSPT